MGTDTILADAIATVEADLDRRARAVHRHVDTALRPVLDVLERFCEELLYNNRDAERLRRELRELIALHEDALGGALRLVDGFAAFDVLDALRAARVDVALQ